MMKFRLLAAGLPAAVGVVESAECSTYDGTPVSNLIVIHALSFFKFPLQLDHLYDYK